MLNPNYTYCFLDFETTGLSHERDDIIQVGLIITNAQLQIINYFSSYVNPGYEVETLKTIVSYTTGISPEQIMSGISLDEFKQKMTELIPDNAVFVGHNVEFDIKFLKKYLGDSRFKIQNSTGDNNLESGILNLQLSIDTLDRMKALIHYQASYSLDVLYPLIKEQLGSDYFRSISQQVGLDDIRNHDALSDCLICVGMMHFSLQKIHGIITSFPIARKIILKASMRFFDSKSINLIASQAVSEKVPLLDFPEKPLATNIKDRTMDWNSIPSGTKLYYGDLPMEQVVRLASGLGKYVIVTNSKQKLSILKSKCKMMGLHGMSFLKEQQKVNKTKLNAIYTKPQLEVREGWFFLKYCSHKLQGLGLLDLNTPGDYKIYNYIREDDPSVKSNIIVATHSALFSVLEQGEYKDYAILFLDHEWRYNSYLKYITTPWDPLNFSRIVENFVYEYNNNKEYEKVEYFSGLMSSMDIWCAVMFMEIRNFTNNLKPDSQGKYEIGVISGNISFPKTNAMYERLVGEYMNGEITENNQIILKQFEKIRQYLEGISYATSTEQGTYTFTLGNFIDYQEFVHLFKGYRHYFLSNWNQTFQPLSTSTHTLPLLKQQFVEVSYMEEIPKQTLGDRVFILNNNPIKAKKLFEYLQNVLWKECKLLVENVTGGRGKNIALSKTNTKWIMVGGYDMLLQCVCEKVDMGQIIVYEQLGLLHQQIITDVKYWMR